MTANTLSAGYTDVQDAVALAMGWHRTLGSWTANNTADFGVILRKGARQFYYPPAVGGSRVSHNWSFLYPLAEIELTTGYSTGTITVSGGTVTGAGTTFPGWAAQGDLWYTSTDGKERRVEVLTLVGDTGLTVGTSSDFDAAALTTYTLRRHYYDLPDDFGGMESNTFRFRRDQALRTSAVELVGEAAFRRMDHEQTGSGRPCYATLVPVPPTATQSSRWKVAFGPLASTTYYLEYRYRAIPPVLDASTNVYHYGGAEHSETFIASVVDMAFQTLRDSSEQHGYFLERLTESVAHDSRNYMPSSLGKSVKSLGDGGGSGRVLLDEFRRSTNPSSITLDFG